MTVGPIADFANHLPVRITFGDGVAHRLPDIAKSVGASRILLLTDENAEAYNPALARVTAALRDSGLTIARVEKPAGEPTIAMVDATTSRMRAEQTDAVIALGGGSVIDTAKAARLCHQLNMSFAEFLDSDRAYPEPTVTLIAAPTTAGTGSEVSGGSVVSDPDAGRKAGIAHPNVRPQFAVVDPELTWSMPPGMTANTGIDALAQAIAATVAKVRTPIGDAIALEAVRLMGNSLLTAYRDGSNVAARSAMSCGSMMAGLAMNISDCAAEHSLGQAIGGLTGAPHGLTIGLVLVETLERERHWVPDQLERVADAWGLPDDGTRDGTRVVTAVRSLLGDLQFPVLSELGLTDADLDRLTDLALGDYFITMSPQPWDRAEVYSAFASALSLRQRQLTATSG
ncbi:iron-containing alcohol dehydrogenase [Mycolicibacterium sp. 120270]|uniref:iron-containing alcohol dehydrogenase family protein n=1 Tax=Mycolicibacterium sp. 120270 TaxID=3090600 RepID=UPI00299F2848|nr:iron-containing alcohol dehydrogenase [Mycolicibacterium sp. 120270]MDX1887571.1 iron-containing alcohol dehydrogenase [Mycolicibacterium sp. 120270]